MKVIFKKYLGLKVEIVFEPGAPHPSKIEEVKFLDEKEQSFSVIFSTENIDSYYNQGSYRVVFSANEEAIVFLVPIGPKDGKMLYEAIFN